MRKLRNFVFFVISLFLVFVNTQLFLNKIHHFSFYLISLDIIISLIIVLDVIYAFHMYETINLLSRKNAKSELAISDYAIESTLLTTLTEVMETLGEEISLNEVLNRIVESVKNLFKKETVILQLFGDNFVSVIKGEKVEALSNMLTDIVLKGHPVLINNTSSFPQYKSFSDQKITSFLVTPLKKKYDIIGVIGVFSFQGRKFSIRDLEFLRMVIAPTTLIIENVELLEKTKILSITDSLTQLYNRRHFEKVITDFVKGKNEEISLCICDIDYFKHYNDTNGHFAGDKVLKKIADILKRGVKGLDVIARYGGEEFVIIFPFTSKENALKVCKMLNKRIKNCIFPNEKKQPNGDLTVSFGIATFPSDAATVEGLIKKADSALYKAKDMGRDRVEQA